MSAKHWCFTDFDMVNTPTELCELWEPLVEYAVFQREWTEKKKQHYQGYVELKKPLSLNQIRKIRRGVHFVKRKGTPLQARDYCMWDTYPLDYRKEQKRGVQKRCTDEGDNGPWEVGVWKSVKGKQGKRTDLSPVVDMVREGKTLYKIAKEHPDAIVRYGNGIKTLIACQKPPPKIIPVVYWFWGASGTGKTYAAETEGGIKDYKVARSNPERDRRFDQYIDGLTTRFVFENWSRDEMTFAHFLQYTDRRRIQIKTMYDVKWFNPQEIYITCTFSPSDLWIGNQLVEVTRRCTGGIREFKEFYTPPTVPNTPSSLVCDEPVLTQSIEDADV